MRIEKDNPNLAMWHTLMPTDAKISVGGGEKEITKSFQRGGGFRGTAINPTYVVMRLTAAFGPVGLGWGYEIIADDVVLGGPVLDANKQVLGHEMVQRTRIRFWWRHSENGLTKQGEFHQVGQTMFVEYRKNSGTFYTDEEAWKKSLTDAITKAASHLGIAADVHLGLWDDNKYVATRAAEAETAIASSAANENSSKVQQLEDDTASLVERLAGATTEDFLNALIAEASVLRSQLRHQGMKDAHDRLVSAVLTARERLGAAA